MTALLTATEVHKSFRQGSTETKVLHGVSMEIQLGEFVAIMGPSGSGKSTLLYCVSGMDAFDAGDVQLGDIRIGTLSEDDRSELRGERMGFVFQDPNLLEALNVMDNILLAASLRPKADADALKRKAVDLMQVTGIGGLEERAVTEISGGQRQRVSLCRALLNSPDLLFGDEPTGALNSKASAEIIELLHGFNSQGMTMLIVTHEPRVAAHATRVLFISDGHLVDELLLDGTTPVDEREQVVMEDMARLGI